MCQHGLHTTPWIDHISMPVEIGAVHALRHLDQGCQGHGIIAGSILREYIAEPLQIFDPAHSPA